MSLHPKLFVTDVDKKLILHYRKSGDCLCHVELITQKIGKFMSVRSAWKVK